MGRERLGARGSWAESASVAQGPSLATSLSVESLRPPPGGPRLALSQHPLGVSAGDGGQESS